MTYVDDDDFDEIEVESTMDEDLEADETGRCDECGLKIKKDDAIVCPACTATYHQWCVTECNRCNTQLKSDDSEVKKPKIAVTRRAAPRKKAAARAPRAR